MIENVLGGFAALLAASMNSRDGSMEETSTRLIIPWQGGWADQKGLNLAIIEGLFDGGFIDDQLWETWSGDPSSWVCFERRQYPHPAPQVRWLTSSGDD